MPPGRFSAVDPKRRVFQLCCGQCRQALTVRTPLRQRRLARATQCRAADVLPGTQAGVLLPSLPAHTLPQHWRPVDQPGAASRTDYLFRHLLRQTRNRGPLTSLKNFPLRPVVEQAAFLTRLGLRLDEAVLATVASEAHYLFALPPRTGVLEMVLAGLVSTLLPVNARPLPPSWAFAPELRCASRRGGLVSFSAWRLWYAWGRVCPQRHAPLPGLAVKYRAMARVLEPLRPYVLALVRPLRSSDYRFPVGPLPGYRSDALMRVVWATCCPGVELDYSEQFAVCRDIPHLLTLM